MKRRCDHDPRNPRLELVARVAPKVPKIIRDGIDATRRIFDKPQLFPELTGRSMAPTARIRKRRSSRLEAIALTAAALVRRCDRRTLRVGDQRMDGLCNGVTREKLCEHTGLSLSRVTRALRELEEGYYIHSEQPVEELPEPKPRGGGRRGMQTHRGFASVRRITPLFWQRLGIKPTKLRKAQAKGYAEWCTKFAPLLSAVDIHATRRALRQFRAAAAPRAPRRELGASHELESATRAKYPDWPLERVRAHVRRLLRERR